MGLKEFIEVGGFVILCGGILWNYAYGKGQADKIEENLNLKIDQHINDDEKGHRELVNEIGKMWEWKNNYIQETANIRLDLQKQIGKIEAGISIHDGQYNEILRLIESMGRSVSEKIDKLEVTIDKLRRN